MISSAEPNRVERDRSGWFNSRMAEPERKVMGMARQQPS
jgi:hypothetical protein